MRGQDDMSALMMAARSGVKELVGLLLERGADSSARDSLGLTALEYAEEIERCALF
jgi:ankyrin repeat protein